MDIKDLQLLEENPRSIKTSNFKKLCESIEKNPRMLEVRPIVIDENNVIKGGNQRYKALVQMGYTEIPDNWIKKVDDFTEDEWNDFIIKDNMNYGFFTIGVENFKMNVGNLKDMGIKVSNWNVKSKINKYDRVEESEMEIMKYIGLNIDNEYYDKWQQLKRELSINDTEAFKQLIDNFFNLL